MAKPGAVGNRTPTRMASFGGPGSGSSTGVHLAFTKCRGDGQTASV